MTRTVIGTALLAALLPLAAFAQSESDTRRDALRRCAGLESLDERVACIDAVLGSEADRAGDARSDEAGNDAARGERGRGRDAAARGARDASEASRRAGDAGAAADRSIEAEPRGTPDRDEDEERTVLVVDVNTSIPGRAIFVTDGGERFEQTTGRSDLFLPSTPFEASIRPGAMGSSFLVPAGQRRAIRVSSDDD